MGSPRYPAIRILSPSSVLWPCIILDTFDYVRLPIYATKVNSFLTLRAGKQCHSVGEDPEPQHLLAGDRAGRKVPDDIGVGVLSKCQDEHVISEHWGRKRKVYQCVSY